jgi:hypothetical protein
MKPEVAHEQEEMLSEAEALQELSVPEEKGLKHARPAGQGCRRR